MTPDQLTRARKRLGLTLEQMAKMLGYEGSQAHSQVHHLETGRREIRPAQRRLVEAYLRGHRPDDWPKQQYIPTVRLEFAIQLHEELRVWYSVDGYVAELRTHDDGRTVISCKGSTPALAISKLEDALMSVPDLAALRAMPNIEPSYSE